MRWLLVLMSVGVASASLSASAGAYEDGWVAFDRGDYEDAAELFADAAEAGNADAQLTLGWLYEQGRGLARDEAAAASWYRAAAEQGLAEAQAALAALYEQGIGVERDPAAAARWYGAAAAQGHGNAQTALNRLLAGAVSEPPPDRADIGADPTTTEAAIVPPTGTGPSPAGQSRIDPEQPFVDEPSVASDPGPAGAGATVQLAAMNTRSGAEDVWRFLLARHGDLLGSLEANYVTVRATTGEPVVQVQTTVDSAEAAETLCRTLRDRGGDCLIVN